MAVAFEDASGSGSGQRTWWVSTPFSGGNLGEDVGVVAVHADALRVTDAGDAVFLGTDAEGAGVVVETFAAGFWCRARLVADAGSGS